MNNSHGEGLSSDRRPNVSDISQKIVEATTACQQSLEVCLSIKCLKTEWAEDRLADFRLWDASVGASSTTQSSLGQKLDAKPHIRSVVLNLLLVLGATMIRCIDLGRQVDQEQDRVESLKESHYQNRKINPENASAEPIESRDSVRGPSLQNEPSSTTADKLLRTIQSANTLLGDLVQISLVIRRASVNSHNAKADSSFRLDDPRLSALREHLKNVILPRARQLEEARNTFWGDDASWFFSLAIAEQADCLSSLDLDLRDRSAGSEYMTPVQERLLKANLKRNHRFRYSRRHALKIGRNHSQSATAGSAQTGLVRMANSGEASNTLPNPASPANQDTSLKVNSLLEAKAVHSTQPATSGLSETAPSSMESAMLKQTARSTTTAQQSATKSSVIAKIKSQYPAPPFVTDSAEAFRCPCCCVILSQKHRGERRWRKHISGDLLPYTCVLSRCIAPETLYATKAEWIKHMIDDHDHPTSYWECAFCATSVLFGSRAEFEAHVQGSHPADATTDIAAYISACSKPKVLAGQGCPLCSVVGEADDVSGKVLLAHVANHVHSLSLNSLPLESDDNENGNKGQYFQQFSYFAESNSEASAASCGTVLEGEQVKNAADESSDEETYSQLDPATPRPKTERERLFRETLKTLLVDEGERNQDRNIWIMMSSSPPVEAGAKMDQSGLDDRGSVTDHEETATTSDSLRSRIQQLLETYVIGLNPEGHYVPDKELTNLLDRDSVENALGNEADGLLTSFILKEAPKAFATLQLVFREPRDRKIAIQAFMISGFDDAALDSHDLVVCDSDQCTPTCPHYFPSYLWDNALLQHFETTKWHFLVPTLDHKVFQYDFDNMQLLPFRAGDKLQSFSSGNFSDVSCVTMLTDKQTKIISQKQEIVVAHKTLRPLNVPQYNIHQEWSREVRAIKELNGVSPHIVQGIAAYRRVARNSKNNTYHIVFEWADGGDLHSFWQANSRPQLNGNNERSRKRLKATLKQLVGLAEALECMHMGGPVPGPEDSHEHSTPSVDASIPVVRVEEPESGSDNLVLGLPLIRHRRQALLGNWRHGDIKPENILRFTENGDDDWIGVLKLTDLGRAQHHTVKTELRKTVEKERWRTRWYEPPDLSEDLYGEAHGRISRLFDIWSMGCVIFETVLWLLYGYDAIERFHRLDSVKNNHSSGTPYWTRVGRGQYQVTDMATSWMEHILNHSAEDTSAIGALVSLVKRKLLQINLPPDSERCTTNHRTNASDMRKELLQIVHKADRNAEYLWDGIRDSAAVPPSAQEKNLNKQLQKDFRFTLQPNTVRNSVDSVPPGRATMLAQPGEYANSLNVSWQYVDDHAFAEQLLAADQIPHDDELCEQCDSLDFMSPFLIFSKSRLISNCYECGLCDLVHKALARVQTVLPADDEIRLERELDCFVARGVKGTEVKILRLCRTNAEPSNATEDVPMGAPVLYDPPRIPKAADAFMKLPRAWLQDCDCNHSQTCATVPRNPGLPQRLVDLRSRRPKIVDSSSIKPGPEDVRYIAFSHCWGNMPQDAVTTQRNLPARRSGIPPKEIPQNLADVIAITRALGCEYLWIDSICTIQGADGDFAEQASLIPAVFSNAYCVVAAVSATGAVDGFLSRDTEQNPLDAVKLGEVYVSAVTNDFDRDVVQGRLYKRGWMLQERALARRTLYFTTNQMYWECGSGVRCETLQKLKSGKTSFLGDAHFPDRTVGPYVTRGEQIHLWTKLFEHYTTLEFAQAGDRAFALNSLIERLASAFQTRSLFGVFESFWGRCLLWRRLSPQKLEPSHRITELPPTWSWMAVGGAIEFLEPEGGQVNWNTDDVLLPFSKQTQSPLSQPSFRSQIATNESATGNTISATAFNFKAAASDSSQVLSYDDGRSHVDGDAQCIIIATTMDKSRHYVLLISAVTPMNCERVGAGYISRNSIDRANGVKVKLR